MNYYDEFGVSPHASAEQIRYAYHALARLVHPDLQQDPELQAVAEQQLRKLNRIHDVLSDPERRRQYDLELTESERLPFPLPGPPPARRAGLNKSSFAWTAAVVGFLILLIWMASRQVSPDKDATDASMDSGAKLAERPAEAPAPKPSPEPPAAAEKEGDQLKQKLAEVLGERDAALAKLKQAEARSQEKQAEPVILAPKEPEPVRIAQLPAPRPAPRVSAKLVGLGPAPEIKPTQTAAHEVAPVTLPNNPIAGDWVYRQSAAPSKNKELFPPEFIETSIVEENGQLRGTYRARYKVPDRPVPPDVKFQFAGRPTGDSISVPWNGTGGSRGQVSFKLMADHSLRVDWVASQLGDLGFYKGTAVLVKKSD